MNSIFIDIELGASGDMLVGSLLDLGLDISMLKNELRKLGLSHWNISPVINTRYNIKGTSANITCEDDISERNLKTILDIINTSALLPKIKNNIAGIFSRLAEAEAAVHNTGIENVHFHEIGAIDSIIDISAFCIGIELLSIEKCYYNEFCFGSGSTKSRHGELSVPAPAVAELTKGCRTRLTGREGELITPTAAAILVTLAQQVRYPFEFTTVKTGTGFGTRNYPFASYTRSFLIETEGNEPERAYQIECNIDDMNPQIYPYIMEILLEQGALDVYITPVGMKKGRPGTLITVIAKDEIVSRVKEILYRETSTIGVRIFPLIKEKLRRSFETMNIYGSDVRIKTGFYNNEPVNIMPEYEDCLKIAKQERIPIKNIFAAILEKISKKEKL